jgi:lipoprotein signal peptidase
MKALKILTSGIIGAIAISSLSVMAFMAAENARAQAIGLSVVDAAKNRGIAFQVAANSLWMVTPGAFVVCITIALMVQDSSIKREHLYRILGGMLNDPLLPQSTQGAIGELQEFLKSDRPKK